MSSEKKMSNAVVAGIVESEGLGYAIEHYMSADEIADPILSARWLAAKEALSAVRDCLESETGQEDT